MIFAKIDFINLLPFYIFVKKYIKSSQIKQIINHKKSYPSHINNLFRQNKIDGAFISSIKSSNKSSLNIGIVSKKDVLSVLVLKNKPKSNDVQSDTSNMLAKILDQDGQVIIGDKALRLYFESKNKDDLVDLSKQWWIKYNLPFVFATLSFNSHQKYLKYLSSAFVKQPIYIPQYILKKYAKNSYLSVQEIKYYLKHIYYTIGYKEKRSLKLFKKLSKNI